MTATDATIQITVATTLLALKLVFCTAATTFQSDIQLQS